jgi:hypothetical protein
LVLSGGAVPATCLGGQRTRAADVRAAGESDEHQGGEDEPDPDGDGDDGG